MKAIKSCIAKEKAKNSAKKTSFLKDNSTDRYTCDEAFASYLVHLAQGVNQNFYNKTFKFVLLYRDCLNLYGPQLLAKAKGKNSDQMLEALQEQYKNLS